MKYRKKPIVVEAIQFTESMIREYEPLPPGVSLAQRSLGPPPERRIVFYRYYVSNLEGDIEVKIDDWIIKGVKGEFYPIKDEIFRETYEPLEEAPDAKE